MLNDLDGMTVALRNPLAEYYAYMDVYLDMPLNVTNYNFITAQVPFLPLVLSGYIPYYSTAANGDANTHRQIMRTLEYGAYASYQMTWAGVQELADTNSCDMFSAQWDLLMEPALERFAALEEVYQALAGAHMTDHRMLQEKVAMTCWSDGTEMVFNYSAKPFLYQGTTVAPESYAILPKGDDAR